MDIQIILTCYLMLNIVSSNLGLKHAFPITEEHEVVPPSYFILTPESKNLNISMTTTSYYVTQDTFKKKLKPQKQVLLYLSFHVLL
jgi:hypothetical protein